VQGIYNTVDRRIEAIAQGADLARSQRVVMHSKNPQKIGLSCTGLSEVDDLAAEICHSPPPTCSAAAASTLSC
jgi:hypothetical protein